MTRTRRILLAVIAVELVVGAVVLFIRPSAPTPPPSDTAMLDAITAGELKALHADRPTAAQWARLGEVELAYGGFPQAEACFRVASGASADADLAFRHAFAVERVGRCDEAIERYHAAVAAGHPRSADAHFYIARNHLRMGRLADANTAFTASGNLPYARYELARLGGRAGNLDAAAREAERLSGEYPTAQQPASLRYRLALLAGDRPAAERLADVFLTRPGRLPNPFDTEFNWVLKAEREFGWKRRLAAAAAGIPNGKAAAADRETTALAAAQWTPELADVRSEALYHLGRRDESAKVLEEAVEKAGPNPHLLSRLGEAYAAAGRAADARAAYERATRVGTGPDVKDAWARLAEQSELSGNAAAAKAELARGLVLVGIERLDVGRPAEAAGALTEATARDPGSAAAWYFLGDAYRESGRPADARAAYDRCLALDPNHGRAARARRLCD